MVIIDSQGTTKSGSGGKEKLRSIMEAASALTSLGDSSDSEGSHTSPNQAVEHNPLPSVQFKSEETGKSVISSQTVKRYIPEHKKPDAALTFPEKLMNMMVFAEQHKQDEDFCIGWNPDGKSFVIRNPDVFTRRVLPKFFKATKFSSFTRKLYRWGFRQVNRGIGPDDPVIFGNEYFQRDNAELMVKMRSITAAGARKAGNDSEEELGDFSDVLPRKRNLDSVVVAEEEQRKRLLLSSLIREKAALGSALAEADLLNFSPALMSSLNQNLNPANSLRTSQDANVAANPLATSSFGLQSMFPKHGLNLLGNNMISNGANHLDLYQAAAAQQASLAPPPSSADIVNAAINALRYAS